jgi:hypothetical protein
VIDSHGSAEFFQSARGEIQVARYALRLGDLPEAITRVDAALSDLMTAIELAEVLPHG